MKRVRAMLGWLLLGAVVNVGVAWGIAGWWRAYGNEEAVFHGDADDHVTLLLRDGGFGTTRVGALPMERKSHDGGYSLVFRHPGNGMPQVGFLQSMTRIDDPAEVLSWWSRLRGEATEHGPATVEGTGFEFAYGWPVRAFRTWNESGDWNGGWTLEGRRATPAKSRVIDSNRRVLPCSPIWRGLSINIIFYAVVAWLALFGLQHSRQFVRRRRGRCPSCAYDLRGSDHERCPECGRECTRSTDGEHVGTS